MKIMIIGCAGAGKSTLAQKLGSKLAIPVYHLDAYYWQPGWQALPKDQWVEFQQQLVQKEQWIIDGNYGGTFEIRMQAADVVILLDFPRRTTMYRIFKRRIKYHGKTRSDLNEKCPERLDWDFIKWVWQFKKKSLPIVFNKLESYAQNTKVIILKSSQDVYQLLNDSDILGNS